MMDNYEKELSDRNKKRVKRNSLYNYIKIKVAKENNERY